MKNDFLNKNFLTVCVFFCMLIKYLNLKLVELHSVILTELKLIN